MKSKVPLIGIVDCVLYFLAVALFLITKADIALTIWETLTIISAPVLLFVLIELARLMDIPSAFRNAMLVFLSCTCSLTGLAHIVNMTVTRKLIADGVAVPLYFQIGFWPSAEMAIDYLAWGFFLGLAFLSVGLAIHGNEKYNRLVKRVVILCGILCLSGFLGTVLVNENLWYLAPVGYGLGSIVICVLMMRFRKPESPRDQSRA